MAVEPEEWYIVYGYGSSHKGEIVKSGLVRDSARIEVERMNDEERNYSGIQYLFTSISKHEYETGLEKPMLSHWDKMSENQKRVVRLYRAYTKSEAKRMMDFIDEAIMSDHFGKLEEYNKEAGTKMVHGCNLWMMNIITIYYSMLEELMRYASDEDREEFFTWRGTSKVKTHLR